MNPSNPLWNQFVLDPMGLKALEAHATQVAREFEEELAAEDLKEKVRQALPDLGTNPTPALPERPESIDRTLKDPEEKDQWNERYLTYLKEAEEKRANRDQAANRLNTNLLNQQQSNRRAITRDIKDVGDAVLGGHHAMFEAIHASQAWDFHDGQQSDERWKVLLSFMQTQAQFQDHMMSELQSINERIDRLQG